MVHGLIQYALLIAGLGGSLGLFLSVKREMHSSAARNRRRLEEIALRLNEAHAREPELVFVSSPAPARSGLNLNKRLQAMRMLRRNEDVSHVAAALGVTRTEIELLIRVQGISRAAAANIAAKSAGNGG
jgi:hypothetical protein